MRDDITEEQLLNLYTPRVIRFLDQDFCGINFYMKGEVEQGMFLTIHLDPITIEDKRKALATNLEDIQRETIVRFPTISDSGIDAEPGYKVTRVRPHSIRIMYILKDGLFL